MTLIAEGKSLDQAVAASSADIGVRIGANEEQNAIRAGDYRSLKP